MILLVHGEEMTRYALNDLGVETSGWESGLKSLLGSQVGILTWLTCTVY